MADPVEVRAATSDDTDGILDLLVESLGWARDPEFRKLYEWKHHSNPFGASPQWVAVDRDRVVGFRAFLRWKFESSERSVHAVRAVDTATSPAYRGRGVFRRLTLHALEELTREGVDIVFNTPNAQSGAGYLSMGWKQIGHVRRRVRPRSLQGALRIVGARTERASRWSESSRLGAPAGDFLADPHALRGILEARPSDPRLSTVRSLEYLRWRYAGVVPSRAVAHRDGSDSGVAFVRVRRQGRARIAIIGDVLVPGRDVKLERELVRQVAAHVDADCAAVLGGRLGARDGFVALGGQGPLVVARALCSEPPWSLDGWSLGYGELELM
jgi:GNAT superfamily N-acetyltransferase